MAEIFVSHATPDVSAAHTIAHELRRCGFESLFLDADPDSGILAGAHWEHVLYEKLIRARAVIVLYSNHWRQSRWCFAELSHARILDRTIIPVILDDAPLDGFLATVQAVKFSDQEALSRIIQALRAVGLSPSRQGSPDPSRAPFPGLLSFQAQDAEVFFGREDEVRRIIDRLSLMRLVNNTRFVLLTGPSGSGKSSVLLAGVLPRLQSEASTWIVHAPIRAGEYQRGSLEADLEQRAGTGGRTSLIAIDQVEECLNPEPTAVAHPLFEDLAGMLNNPERRVLAVGTARTNAVTELECAFETAGIKLDLLHVDPISKAGLKAAIEAPCELYGIRVDEELVDRVATDCADWRALPALAYTLREMYERTSPPRRFSKSLYEQLGGVGHILNERIQVLIAGSGLPESEVRKALFELVAMSANGEFRRVPARRNTFEPTAVPFINLLIDARVLVASERDGYQIVEWAHESLLRDFTTLAQWLERYREYFEWRPRFSAAVFQFKRHGAVLPPGAIAEADHWHKEGIVRFDESALALLKASEEQARFRALAIRAWALIRIGGSFAVLWLLAGWAVGEIMPGTLSFRWASELARYQPVLFLTAIFSLAGGCAGILAFGRRAFGAFTGVAVFLVLLLASATARLRFEETEALKFFPFALTGPVILLLFVGGSNRTLSNKRLVISAIFLSGFGFLTRLLSDPNLGQQMYGFAGLSYQTFWQRIISSWLILPKAVPLVVHGNGFTAAAGILLASAAAISLLGGRNNTALPSPDAARRYVYAIGAAAVALLCFFVVLVPFANREFHRAETTTQASHAALKLSNWQDSFKERTSHYAASMNELDRVARDWARQSAALCRQATMDRKGLGTATTESLPPDLKKESYLGDRVFTNQDTYRFDIVYSSSDGWAGNVRSAADRQVGCTISEGKVPEKFIPPGIPIYVGLGMALGPPQLNLVCNRLFYPLGGEAIIGEFSPTYSCEELLKLFPY